MQLIPKNFKKITRKILLSLPSRQWDEEKTYDFLFIIPHTHMHDSGYRLQAIIGVCYKDKEDIEAEIAAVCDDICWSFPKDHPYGKRDIKNKMIMRTDCLPNNIFRFWGSSEHYFTGKFKVGINVSSTDVELIVVPVGDGVNKITGEKII